MNFKLLATASTAALLMSGAHALAATVVLDDFNTNQSVLDDPFPTTVNSSTIAFGAGERTLTAENTANNGTSEGATTLQVSGGALAFSNNDGATGMGTLTYTALGDISSGTNPFFLFDVGTFDNVANFTASATDGGGVTSTYSEVLQPGFSDKLFFSQFAGGADFNDIATLSFTIDTTNVPGFGAVESVDGALNSISISAIPLPASGLLLFGALGGFAALRRRKASKA